MEKLEELVSNDPIAKGDPSKFMHPVVIMQSLNEAVEENSKKIIPWDLVLDDKKDKTILLASYMSALPHALFLGPGCEKCWNTEGFDMTA